MSRRSDAPGGEALNEVLHQHREIPAARAQRRDLEIERVDPVVEILAEQPVGDARAQVAVGRRDDAHVDLHRVVAAERLDRPLLQHAQQLGLRRQRQLRDLVQEQRAAVRGLEAALAAVGGAGERAALVPEQLRLDQRVGERARS